MPQPAPAQKQANANNQQSTINNQQPLVLTEPASNTGYQIHPSLPVANQRIEVAGYVTDGQPWAELRLVKDGESLAEATDGTRLRTWWTLTAGQHVFWLEGRRQPGDELTTSVRALVVVEPFSQATAAVSGALR